MQATGRWLAALAMAGAVVILLAAECRAAAPSAGPDVIDVTADKALRVRAAIKQGDYRMAEDVATEVLAASTNEGWSFQPFTQFINNVVYGDDPAFGTHLDEWVTADQNSALPLLVRAQYLYAKGWVARGHNYISNTQKDRIASFAQDMARALSDVDAAIRIDDRNPYAFGLKLRILQGHGITPQMTHVFEQAIEKFPTYYPLYDIYLTTLQPRWGGSIPAMYAFVSQYGGGAPQNSPLKMLYLSLYRDILASVYVNCNQIGADRDRTIQCINYVMSKTVAPFLEHDVLEALQLYDHTDRYQFGLAIRDILFTMIGVPGGDTYSGAVLELAARAMHSDTQLTESSQGHNDYIIDEVVAASWNAKGFFDNAIAKYKEALADAQAGAFPTPQKKDLAIAYIYVQLADISGNSLHEYNDMIDYERLAVAHGLRWDEQYICYAEYKLKRYQDAIQECTEAIHSTDNPLARYWRAVTYRTLGKTDEALRDFTDVADSEGYFASSAAIEMSMIYFGHNDNQGALNVLNRYTYLYDANRTNKSDVAIAYNNRCYAYMQLGDLQRALSDCTDSLRYGSIPDAFRKQQELVKRLGQ